MTIPAIILILSVFAGMLLLTRLQVPLGAAAIFGAIVLDLWGRRWAPVVLADLIMAITSLELWLLLLTIVLIIEFGRYMTEKDNARAIISTISRFAGRYGRTWMLMIPPAVIGLVPMPGGALFSAPLVGQASESLLENDREILSPEDKTAINYWFRHVWEYWWPLYPGIIVAMTVFDMELWRFAAAQAPVSVVAIIAGYVFLIRPHRARFPEAEVDNSPHEHRAILLVLPLVLVVACTMGLRRPMEELFPGLSGESHRLLAMLAGLVAGSAVIIFDERRRGGTHFLASVLKPKSINVVISVFGILVFRYMLKTSGLVTTACRELNDWGLSPVVAVVALPFLAGMVTGLAYGFTGISFPLVVELMNSTELTPMATLVLAFGCGYMGMIFSPVHICLIVSKDYFDASMAGSLRKILPCGITIVIFCIAAYLLFSSAGL